MYADNAAVVERQSMVSADFLCGQLLLFHFAFPKL